jgi:hypothetical protein
MGAPPLGESVTHVFRICVTYVPVWFKFTLLFELILLLMFPQLTGNLYVTYV